MKEENWDLTCLSSFTFGIGGRRGGMSHSLSWRGSGWVDGWDYLWALGHYFWWVGCPSWREPSFSTISQTLHLSSHLTSPSCALCVTCVCLYFVLQKHFLLPQPDSKLSVSLSCVCVFFVLSPPLTSHMRSRGRREEEDGEGGRVN